ncbi:GntR family transcriptional regulator [Paracoccus sp. (in: a-proteobacteria)]|uniref:GntR family transcriptional regulator n=1 Tax=Paracoccus sp. TaxID=267 RepID=UPI003A857E2A
MKPIAPPKSLMELTAERIRDAIIQGELELGSKVSEQKLADMLQISRSPVREALALLQIEGLIRVLPKRGSFVFTPDDKTVADLCEHRSILESACLALAIARNPEALTGRLRQGIDQMRRAIARDDVAGYSAGDMRFHKAIVECSDNQSIAGVYDSTLGPLMALRTHVFRTGRSHFGSSMAEHAALLEACEQRDAARAQQIIGDHIRQVARYYRETGPEGQPKRLTLVG